MSSSMSALGLLTCVVLLTAFSAQAEVVSNFNNCRGFFYKNTEPGGMDQKASKICQMYGEEELMSYHYATLYSTHHRIPLYSAYTFDPRCRSDSGRTKIWHVEPQLSDYPIRSMVRETDSRVNKSVIKISQAVNSDYRFSGYDRGHLNPNSFNCGAGRTATFTLTNAAPMDPRFNGVHWEKWEMTLRSILLNQLKSDYFSATAYIVTGAVPNAAVRIPRRENPEELSEDYERVSVPSHVWTAVCYEHHSDDRKSFSFAYMGKNQREEPGINLMRVSDLNDRLSGLYSELSGTGQIVNIFVDGCFHDDDDDDDDDLDMVKLLNFINLSGRKKVKVKEMIVKLVLDIINTYSIMSENRKLSESAYLRSNGRPVVFGQLDLWRRDVSEWPDAECLLKTAADGSQCSSVSESRDSCRCTSGGQTKPCCSSPCQYLHHLEDYRCSSGETLIKCSPPRYSLITANGAKCKDDHPCATYGYDYYWCNKASGGWDYCSPPLWSSKAKNGKFCRSDHACAKYGSSSMWCYTDDKGNYDKCCTSDDCSSAVNGQTCRPDHKCGYHGGSYLWCYTDNRNNWDYCCTNCA